MSKELKPDLRRVLSIRQPWANLIIRPDLPTGSAERAEWMTSPDRKDIENRTWSTSYRGTLYIHASLRWDADAGFIGDHFPGLASIIDESRGNGEWALTGGIIGRVNLVDVVQRHRSSWFAGPDGWVLEDPEIVPFEGMKGRLGLFLAGETALPAVPAQPSHRIDWSAVSDEEWAQGFAAVAAARGVSREAARRGHDRCKQVLKTWPMHGPRWVVCEDCRLPEPAKALEAGQWYVRPSKKHGIPRHVKLLSVTPCGRYCQVTYGRGKKHVCLASELRPGSYNREP